MGNVKNETGKVYERLTVLERSDNDKYGQATWLCKCSCGNLTTVTGALLRSGNTKSCGCLNLDRVAEMGKEWGSKHQHMATEAVTTHGHHKNGKPTRTYKTWQCMKQRCFNPNAPNYHLYGGRGITVCDRWKDSFENFLQDMGERPEGTTLDRINPFQSYTPDNCRWATPTQQNNNKRSNYLRRTHVKHRQLQEDYCYAPNHPRW
jgi:hypothetical protein